MSNSPTWKHSRLNETLGVLAWSLALLVFICLLSYDAFDPSMNVTATREIHGNAIGRAGAYTADLLLQSFGYAAFLVPFPLVAFGYKKIRSRRTGALYIHIAGIALVWMATAAILEFWRPEWISVANFTPGGVLGIFVKENLVPYLNVAGSVIILTATMTVGILLCTPLSLAAAADRVESLRIPPLSFSWLARLPYCRSWKKSRTAGTPQDPISGVGPDLDDFFGDEIPTAPPAQTGMSLQRGEPLTPFISARPPDALSEPGKALRTIRPVRASGDFQLPSLDFLQPAAERSSVQEEELLQRAEQLTQKCSEFDVLGHVEQIHPGPVVTTYEFKPQPGIKYSRLTNLVDDLCLAMRAESIRIDRIPGKNTVGIEVPNANRDTILLREIINADVFQRSRSLLTLALGKLIHGETYVSDLKKMPHLLIAGATGSGKSVALNAMVVSMLYKASPEQVKFIMIDPKRLELGVYDGIPHLLTPIVTDPKRAANSLSWAVTEMENRYKRLAGLGVRNIDQYNSMVESESFDPSDDENNAWMPYIVVIIDELADLMMVAAKDVEESITRLAQMARAVGIHLILATQRPSVDVITGLIKANFPSRISFRVSSKIDSRTILDTNGAEQLLGLGDMLFLPPGTSRLIRIHGPFVSEKEIHSIVSFLKEQADPAYHEEILEDPAVAEPGGDPQQDWDDELYREAARFVVDIGRASTSLLQRRFRIGYGRAARLIDLMERDGVVGPADGSKPREVLKGSEYYREVDERL